MLKELIITIAITLIRIRTNSVKYLKALIRNAFLTETMVSYRLSTV